jgi:glycosyltransferase involved in cell wall biosynthesis
MCLLERELQMIQISVITCTHNPRSDYLERVLDGLKGQTLPKDRWEFLLIDNGSRDKVAEGCDLRWHPNGRHVREEELGLTPARIRGIHEAQGDLLVFVDDDNVLDGSYLENALRIRDEYKHLGAYGAGRIVAEFEIPPPPETLPHLKLLTIRDEKAPLWANLVTSNSSLPYGAGLCVLREIAWEYARQAVTDYRRKSLGRQGQLLLSSEDIDLAFFACKLGRGTGVFPTLALVHLIPPRRLSRDYLVRLAQGHAFSHVILARLWGFDVRGRENRALGWLRDIARLVVLRGFDREIHIARWRGTRMARRWLQDCSISPN